MRATADEVVKVIATNRKATHDFHIHDRIEAGIQLENIGPGHQHIDLVYFAVPQDGAHQVAEHCVAEVGAAWFSLAELGALGADDEIQAWCQRALNEVEAGPSGLSSASREGILSVKSD